MKSSFKENSNNSSPKIIRGITKSKTLKSIYANKKLNMSSNYSTKNATQQLGMDEYFNILKLDSTLENQDLKSLKQILLKRKLQTQNLLNTNLDSSSDSKTNEDMSFEAISKHNPVNILSNDLTKDRQESQQDLGKSILSLAREKSQNLRFKSQLSSRDITNKEIMRSFIKSSNKEMQGIKFTNSPYQAKGKIDELLDCKEFVPSKKSSWMEFYKQVHLCFGNSKKKLCGKEIELRILRVLREDKEDYGDKYMKSIKTYEKGKMMTKLFDRICNSKGDSLKIKQMDHLASKNASINKNNTSFEGLKQNKSLIFSKSSSAVSVGVNTQKTSNNDIYYKKIEQSNSKLESVKILQSSKIKSATILGKGNKQTKSLESHRESSIEKVPKSKKNLVFKINKLQPKQRKNVTSHTTGILSESKKTQNQEEARNLNNLQESKSQSVKNIKRLSHMNSSNKLHTESLKYMNMYRDKKSNGYLKFIKSLNNKNNKYKTIIVGNFTESKRPKYRKFLSPSKFKFYLF